MGWDYNSCGQAFVKQVKENFSSFPCKSFSRLLSAVKRKECATCIRDHTGVSGEAWGELLNFMVTNKIGDMKSENVPCAAISCPNQCDTRGVICVDFRRGLLGPGGRPSNHGVSVVAR